jgi:hypothetical protein
MTYAIIGLLAFVFVTALFFELRNRVNEYGRENTALQIRMAVITERVHKLERASRLRMPHEAMDKIMNAMAALDALEREKKLETDFIENSREWLAKAMSTGTKRDHE